MLDNPCTGKAEKVILAAFQLTEGTDLSYFLSFEQSIPYGAIQPRRQKQKKHFAAFNP